MRAETATELGEPRADTREPGPTIVRTGSGRGGPDRPVRSRRIDRFDLFVLTLFALTSLWVLGLDLWQVVIHGRTWTGTDGVYIVDQMQYLAWIRSASQHFLIQNLFVLRPTSADYFQPLIQISGGLTALGVAPWLALLLWKPVAVGGAFLAVRAYVRRSLGGLWPRRSALVLALFFGSFTIVLGDFGVLGDLFPGFLSWGYVFALIGLAAMAGALVAYDRSWGRRRWSWAACVLGALASLNHPWNGEMLIAVIVIAELYVRIGRRRAPWHPVLLISTLAATAAPLLYYFLLGRYDLSWKLARDASKHAFSLWSILLVVVPLLIPALIAYRRRPQTFLASASRSWLIAALVIYVLSASALGATPLHAWQGITIPMSVLAVEGAGDLRGLARGRLGGLGGRARFPRPQLAAAILIALFTIPATAYEFYTARKLALPRGGNGNFITADERDAIDYLNTVGTPGGVLTRGYLGAVVPGRTGRQSYVGDCLWSEPDCPGRTDNAQALFTGGFDARRARQFVSSTGARFLLADCGSTANLPALLGSMVRATRRFGCAAVYEVAQQAAPLTESQS